MTHKIRAVIVDDIEDARLLLKQDLKEGFDNVEIVGEADGVVSGAKLIAKTKPDLVFLDIEMPDGDGFDLLEMLSDKNFKTIFITASDAHAIKAFKFSAIDYILKPLDTEELHRAVTKAIGTIDHKESMSLLQENISKPITQMERIALNTQEKIHVERISNIVRCESDVNYTNIYLSDGSRIMVSKTLKEFDEMLKDYGFIRVHQSHLVNTEYIKAFVKTDGGHLTLSVGKYVPVSSRKKSYVMEVLGYN
jgi:two-component system LytT family response regulator